MKSEHRHELAENDLSKILAKWGAEFDKHANTILSVLIVIALLTAGIIFWTRTSATTSALGWTDLANARSPEDFQNVAETYAGTPVAEWATLQAADGLLREGIRLSLSDRPASNERLEQAKSSFQALLKNTNAPKEIREQALMGNAVTLESLSDGDTNDAIAAYEQVLKEFPNTRFKKYAEDRIAELKTGGAQDFYAWFHRLNPKPTDLPGPQDSPKLPGPGDLSNLLPELGGSGIPKTETAPFEIPSDAAKDATDANPFADKEMQDKSATPDAKEDNANTSDAPPTETKTSDAETTDKPATAEEKPAEPKDDAPAETPEADDNKPAAATEQPAESKPAEPAEESAPQEQPSTEADDAADGNASE